MTAKSELHTKIRGKCLAALARREHSRFELQEKCVDFPREAVNLVLQELSTCGLQSDERFAKNFARCQSSRGQGLLKIRHALQQKGIAGELLQETLAEIDWFVVAEEVYRRKYSSPPKDAKEHAKRVRFLMGRGFTFAHIKAVEKNLECE